MGNSPSTTAPVSAAPVSAAPPAPVPAPSATSTSPPSNSTGNNKKTVIQVPAENVTVSKGGKRRRLRGGVASVQFDLTPRLQPSDAMMERVTSAPSSLSGGKRRRSHKRKTHRRRSNKRKFHRRKTFRK